MAQDLRVDLSSFVDALLVDKNFAHHRADFGFTCAVRHGIVKFSCGSLTLVRANEASRVTQMWQEDWSESLSALEGEVDLAVFSAAKTASSAPATCNSLVKVSSGTKLIPQDRMSYATFSE